VRVTFLLTLLLSLVFLFANTHILAVFGPEFIAAKAALGILILGNLVDVASGSPTLLLVMTGHERSVAVIFSIIAVISVFLNLLLISSYGFIGAALASAVSLFLSRCIMVIYSIMVLQLNPTIFAFLKKRKTVR
jgi:O-antigen/teichoic acid export membrane protein